MPLQPCAYLKSDKTLSRKHAPLDMGLIIYFCCDVNINFLFLYEFYLKVCIIFLV
jgi:hypothetical protein